MKKKVVQVKVRGYQVINEALDLAVERGMNRCDKYNEDPLTEGQRNTLANEIVNSFWIYLEDIGVELKP